MMMPEGEARRILAKWWAHSIVSRSAHPESYLVRFPCPECGCDAYEMFLQVPEPEEEVARKLSLSLDGYALWVIRWTSSCGHVRGGRDEPACVATPIKENGQIVGMIEPVSPPPWYRYEKEGARGTCVAFGTRWQAEHASNAEFRRLAAIRKDEPETFTLSRNKTSRTLEKQALGLESGYRVHRSGSMRGR